MRLINLTDTCQWRIQGGGGGSGVSLEPSPLPFFKYPMKMK